MTENKSYPWKNGYYKLSGNSFLIFLVEGERVQKQFLNSEVEEGESCGTWTFGEFEEARKEIKDYTGKKNYNVAIEMPNKKTKGVVNDAGTKVTLWKLTNRLGHFEHISNKELASLKGFGDPASAPTHHYEIRPDIQGRLLWLSGVPGSGKSTTGSLLSKTKGYVYYEADTFGYHLNPYLPADVDEPSLCWPNQKPLKEIPKERIDAVNKGKRDFWKLLNGEEYNQETIEEFYTEMCKNIKYEKQRIRGDWVVAAILPTRSLRDHIKKELGPDLFLILLDITKEDQMKRLIARHGNDVTKTSDFDWLMKMYEVFEPTHPDEVNVIDVVVTDDLTREDVVEKLLSVLT